MNSGVVSTVVFSGANVSTFGGGVRNVQRTAAASLLPGLRRGARRNLDAVAGRHREAIDRARELEAQGAVPIQRHRPFNAGVTLTGTSAWSSCANVRQRNHRLTERDAQVGGDVDVTDRLVAEYPQRSGVGRLRLRVLASSRAERLGDRGADTRARERFRRTLERNRSPSALNGGKRSTTAEIAAGSSLSPSAAGTASPADGRRVARGEHHRERPGGAPDPSRTAGFAAAGAAFEPPRCTRWPRCSGTRRWPPTNEPGRSDLIARSPASSTGYTLPHTTLMRLGFRRPKNLVGGRWRRGLVYRPR